MVSCNGSSHSPIASSSGLPSPTPSNTSSHFSDSSWADANYLSADNTYHSNSSAELLPQSPLGTNNLSGFHSSYEETFLPGLFSGIPGSSEQFPLHSLLSSSTSSSEYLTGVSDPLVDDFLLVTSDRDQIFHPSPESPARQYLPLFRYPSQLEFSEGSSSQPIPCKTEAPDPKAYFKLQVASEAAVAVSEKKRKNPQICTCNICGRGFTRKHSRACKFNPLFTVSCPES